MGLKDGIIGAAVGGGALIGAKLGFYAVKASCTLQQVNKEALLRWLVSYGVDAASDHDQAIATCVETDFSKVARCVIMLVCAGLVGKLAYNAIQNIAPDSPAPKI